jgi:hypothetical protein
MNKSDSAPIKIVALIAAVLFIGLLFSYPAMLLWNYCLVPAIPALSPVTWLQMYGIQVLLSILVPKASYDRSSN